MVSFEGDHWITFPNENVLNYLEKKKKKLKWLFLNHFIMALRAIIKVVLSTFKTTGWYLLIHKPLFNVELKMGLKKESLQKNPDCSEQCSNSWKRQVKRCNYYWHCFSQSFLIGEIVLFTGRENQFQATTSWQTLFVIWITVQLLYTAYHLLPLPLVNAWTRLHLQTEEK